MTAGATDSKILGIGPSLSNQIKKESSDSNLEASQVPITVKCKRLLDDD